MRYENIELCAPGPYSWNLLIVNQCPSSDTIIRVSVHDGRTSICFVRTCGVEAHLTNYTSVTVTSSDVLRFFL